MRALLVLGIALTPALAAAQSSPVDPLRSPGFVTLDRFDQNSRVGIDASYLVYDDDKTPIGDPSGFLFDLHGHYVDKGTGLGGYLMVPLSKASGDLGGAELSETALGNVELGALYMKQFANVLGVVARVGLVVPTADDDPGKSAARSLTGPARVTDLILTSPKTTAVRVSVSPLIRAGKIFARGDLGYDLMIDNANDNEENVLRVGAGAGYDGGSWAAGAEVAHVSIDEASLTTVGLFGRFQAGPITPYLAAVIPLGDDLDYLTLAFTLGVEGKLTR